MSILMLIVVLTYCYIFIYIYGTNPIAVLVNNLWRIEMKKYLRRLFGLIFCFFFLASGTSLAASFSYNFNNLTGNP